MNLLAECSQREEFISHFKRLERTRMDLIHILLVILKIFPFFLLIKTLGITSDKDIVALTNLTDSDIIFQMSEYSGVSNTEDAIELLSRKFNLIGSTNEKEDRVSFYINNFVLPHVGVSDESRIAKAQLICKLLKRYYGVSNGIGCVDDKDHFSNKRVRLVGQLFEHLFVNNFNELIIDILTNFQRMIKRRRFFFNEDYN